MLIALSMTLLTNLQALLSGNERVFYSRFIHEGVVVGRLVAAVA